MKILVPADGSDFTKKALAYLMTHENLCGPNDELVVLNVQTPMPPRVKRMVGSASVNSYHEEEARRVLDPIERFLKRHSVHFTCRCNLAWSVLTLSLTCQLARPRAERHM